MSDKLKITLEWMDKDGNYHDFNESPIDELIKERDELQEKLDMVVHTLSIYADDRNWYKTPTLTQWTLNPNPSILAKDTLRRLCEP